jgi:hypothetical protein
LACAAADCFVLNPPFETHSTWYAASRDFRPLRFKRNAFIHGASLKLSLPRPASLALDTTGHAMRANDSFNLAHGSTHVD